MKPQTKRQSTDRFVVRKDGTVLDRQTGLVWQADYAPGLTWRQGMAYAKKRRLGGHADWRLPTIEELVTLIDFTRHVPASAFPLMPCGWFWSSKEYVGCASEAWGINFYYGYVNYVFKTLMGYVRCVRRG